MPRNLSEFRLASKEEIEKNKKTPKGFIDQAIYPWSPGGINRTIIYKIMDESFGAFNFDPGENSNWGWVICTDTGLLTVYDYKGGWSIGRLHSDLSGELKAEATSLRDALFKEAKKIRVSKKQIAKEKIGGAIRNPYSLYRGVTKTLLEQADYLQKEIIRIRSENDFSKFVESSNLLSHQGRLFLAAFMSTFLSLEGFINLVYKLFLRDRYRNDFYERRLRDEMFPTKILEMDVYCHSFNRSPFNQDEELFSAVQNFINLRNLFLHANISEPMESHFIKHGKYYLHIKNEAEGKGKFGLTVVPDEITKMDVIRANKLVEKSVIKVIQALEPGIRSAFAIVHDYMWIDYYWDKKDSIVFPLDEDDIKGSEETLKFLEQSTELDKDYFAVDKG